MAEAGAAQAWLLGPRSSGGRTGTAKPLQGARQGPSLHSLWALFPECQAGRTSRLLALGRPQGEAAVRPGQS